MINIKTAATATAIYYHDPYAAVEEKTQSSCPICAAETTANVAHIDRSRDELLSLN
jgi:uncharacterized protein CbrC (UPF0167 family)